jgi:hypothetical protein
MLLNLVYLLRNISKRCEPAAGLFSQESEVRVLRVLPAAAAAPPMMKKYGAIVSALLGPPARSEALRPHKQRARAPFGQLGEQRLLRDPQQLRVGLEVHAQKLGHSESLRAHRG